jgi:hypothetical protein
LRICIGLLHHQQLLLMELKLWRDRALHRKVGLSRQRTDTIGHTHMYSTLLLLLLLLLLQVRLLDSLLLCHHLLLPVMLHSLRICQYLWMKNRHIIIWTQMRQRLSADSACSWRHPHHRSPLTDWRTAWS